MKNETAIKTVPDIEPYLGHIGREKTSVNQYGLDGRYLKTFDSIRKASKELKISYSAIYGCVQGKLHQTHRFQFRRAEQ
jgi:NUMOD1 domain